MSWRYVIPCFGRRQFPVFLAILALACDRTPPGTATDPLTAIGESYVRLARAVGVHDPDYVDAWYGPAAWKTAAEAARVPLAEIRTRAAALLDSLRAITLSPSSEVVALAGASNETRWRVFSGLLASPRLPQDLFPSEEQ